MNRYFNITGCCNPQEHYMVNLDSRLAQIKKMVDKGQYFSINKGRQYGKTTILKALREHLKNDYVVISVDFQFVSTSEFATENRFVKAFARLLWSRCFCSSVFNPRPYVRGYCQACFWYAIKSCNHCGRWSVRGNTVPFW